ncbi:MAG: shikimate kinase [Ruminococcaceae bacterium]|nr:shikimate kinase [Oscillospiraceae bacterium]
MKNIILVGLPGCGKTTLGKLLAKRLNLSFIDCDEVIEETEKKAISKIFEEFGEDTFRGIETQTLRNLLTEQNAVIATGGGCVERRENFEILKKLGTVVFINRPFESIIGDIDISKRPLLTGRKARLYTLSERRMPLYKDVCDLEITGDDDPDILVDKILDEVKKNG